MTPEEWLSKATCFEIDWARNTLIEGRRQNNDIVLWVINENRMLLGKDGEWHYEPLPSSRTDEFKELTRFASPDEAYDFFTKHKTNYER